jgi:peptidoglycan/xylan/chitin deacetylase (PgdA/CDA1 family)
VSAARQLVRHALAHAMPRGRFLVRGPSAGHEVALTFDDGPHPEHTPRLLDALAASGLLASFFLVGREAERHPGIVTRIAAEGHAIGHHSWTHSEPAVTSAATLLDEVTRCRSLLATLLGREVNRFRPPKGALTLAKLAGLWRAGQQVVLWSADPRDYAMADAAPLLAWAGGHSPQGGEIVLLHDNHPHAIEAVPALAAWRAAGCRFVTLDAWPPAVA